MRKTTLCFSALALGMSVIGATTAHAGNGNGNGPQVEHFEDVFSVEDEFLSEVCGFTVMVDGDVRGTVRARPDGSIHVNERGTVVLSNAESGKTLTNWWRQNYKGQGTETFNDDGTLTITFDDKVTGIPERWFDNDGKTLIMDRGYARFIGEVVIDLETDEVIHFHEEIVTHGPHPALENGLDPLVACELLS